MENKTASKMTITEYWAKRGADHYHADVSPLFARDRKGVIHTTIDCHISRDLEDHLQEAGEAYLDAFEREAASFQQRRA